MKHVINCTHFTINNPKLKGQGRKWVRLGRRGKEDGFALEIFVDKTAANGVFKP